MFDRRYKKKEGMRTRNASVALILVLTLLLTLWGGVFQVSAALPDRDAAVPVAARSGERTDDGLLIDGITYVAFRTFVVFADNCEVHWDAESRTATAITSTGTKIRATVGETVLRFGARRFYTVAPIRIVNDRLYVPIRPLARAFGMEVDWSVRSRSVLLTQTSGAVQADEGVYQANDLYWLSRIIFAEAGGESFDGMVAVGNVILNRVAHRSYPNTVKGVIFDRRHGIQFTPAATGSIYRTPSAAAIDAAKVCLEGYTLSDDILYFFNPAIASSSWIENHRIYVFRIGRHVFYR